MKRKLALCILLCVFSLENWAQTVPEHAFGLRFSGGSLYGGALNYQYSADEETRFEFNIGLLRGLNLDATEIQITYQWVFPMHENFDWYAGGGGKLGFQSENEDENKTPFGISVVGQAGIQYTFDIPLHISLDLCPDLLTINYSNHAATWVNLNLSVRYLLF